jgi:hypothetical protein
MQVISKEIQLNLGGEAVPCLPAGRHLSGEKIMQVEKLWLEGDCNFDAG